MKVCLTLSCLFLLRLQDGDAVRIETGKVGGNITVTCSFGFSGSRKFVCKGVCDGGNILINTTNKKAQRGRFSIRYEKNGVLSSDYMYFTIKDLIKSDSGRYRCRSDKTWTGTLNDDFELIVNEAFTVSATSEPDRTLQTFATSTILPTIFSTSVQRLSSSTPLSETNQHTADQMLLYMGLSLAILIIVLALALLVFFKKKCSGQKKGPSVKTEYGVATQASPVYVEIREEERENKPPPGEISSVYVYAKTCKPHRAESNDIYSLASYPQKEVEDDIVDYSEVHSFEKTTISSNSAPCGRAVDVIYSEPLLAAASANHSNDSPPLYSNILSQP